MRVWKLKNGDTFKDYGFGAFSTVLKEIVFRDPIDSLVDEHITFLLASGEITKQEVETRRNAAREQLQYLMTSPSDKENTWREVSGTYQNAVDGDTEAATSLWLWLPDYERLLLTLHFWSGVKEDWITPEVWGTILCNTWQRGKAGCLLLNAVVSTTEITEMFEKANLKSLMSEDNEFETYNNLPDKVEIWRGTSSQAGHQSTGMSWTLDPIQAEWFALFRSGSATPLLCRTVVEKKDILAAFDYEKEIVVNPVKLAKAASIDIKIIPNAKIRAQQVRQMLEDRQFA
ncbi:hypothetical protein [Burkholderia pseudomallei]|uniref:hypothetical protein n=1 Tax=Burkholderia pseudomallei TaxID=28450 RepID=UPI0005EA3FBC|nr:hypothetical protein [Burkholderia pseudomallei]BEH31529.1 hypothetical protein GTC054_27450 [Burkholderia pseudomallei]CAK1273281.1 Uncharacterised protein [Burkholderia pseudomallei]CAK1281228.1 Uncharacterised protein [Burkholderia pseudomallei]